MNKIPLFKVFMADTAAPEVTKVLNSGFIGQGPKVDEFELNLKNYFEHPYIQTVNAGTSALHLALHLLKKPKPHWNEDVFQGVAWVNHNWPGLEEGDEVLCTAMTCTASNWPVLANGLKIKWVDIDPETLNIDLNDLESKIIKTPLDPDITYSDDPLRMMRAIRFATQLNFEIEIASLSAINKNAQRLKIITRERIIDELNKILSSTKPSIGFLLLEQTDLLLQILPELSSGSSRLVQICPFLAARSLSNHAPWVKRMVVNRDSFK